MRATQVWLGLWVAGMMAAGGSWWQGRTARTEREALRAKNQAGQVALRAALAKNEQRASRARAEGDQARAALAQLAETLPTTPERAEQPPAAPSTAKIDPPKTFAELVRRSVGDSDRPEEQVRWFALLRAANHREYAAFFRGLNLDDAQRAAFVAHKAKLDEQHSDLNAAARAQGFGTNDPAIIKLRGELYSTYEKSQRELLGEAGYRELKEFERTSDVRSNVADLAGLAAVSGLALTPVQRDQLVRAIAEASPTYRKGGRANLALDVEWPVLQAAMANILTEEQHTLFATQEPGGSGLFFARWNAELVRATRAEKAKTAPKP